MQKNIAATLVLPSEIYNVSWSKRHEQSRK